MSKEVEELAEAIARDDRREQMNARKKELPREEVLFERVTNFIRSQRESGAQALAWEREACRPQLPP